MAYTYAYTNNGSPSTILRDDGIEFPRVPGNRHYDEWLAFTAGGGTTDDAPTISLGDRQDTAKVLSASMAQTARDAATAAIQGDPINFCLRAAEALAYELAITPVDADYPILQGLVDGGTYASVDLAHDGVLADLATLKTALAAVAEGLGVVDAAIDAAADQTEIDAALAAADFDGA